MYINVKFPIDDYIFKLYYLTTSLLCFLKNLIRESCCLKQLASCSFTLIIVMIVFTCCIDYVCILRYSLYFILYANLLGRCI